MLPQNLSKYVDGDGNFDFSQTSDSQKSAEQKIHDLASLPKAPAQQDPLKIPRAGNSPAEATIGETLNSVGLSEEQIVKEFADGGGQLGADSYQKLASRGFTRALADAFLVGQLAIQRQDSMEKENALSSAQAEASGNNPNIRGDQALSSLLQWAGSSGAFTTEEMNALDIELDDPRTAVMAVQTIKGRHQSALGAGNAAPLIEGAPASAGGTIQLTKSNAKQVLARARSGDPRSQQAIASAQADGSLVALLI